MVVFSNAMQNTFHAAQFGSRANSRVFSDSSLVKTGSAVATVKNLFVRRFEQAVGHLVSEKWSSADERPSPHETGANGPETPNEVKTNWHEERLSKSPKKASSLTDLLRFNFRNIFKRTCRISWVSISGSIHLQSNSPGLWD